ncbi:MAG: hypothetical protein H3C36_02050 [Chitinophagaceae bacterium]|nr:hypothetical protein [Chitinophagaceae bacterium]
MRYFIHLPEHNKPKNKLNARIQDHLETLNHTITGDIQKTFNELKDAVSQFNAEFPRCKPLRFDTWKTGEQSFGALFCDYWTCILLFYAIKESIADMSECPECLQPASKEELNTFGGLCEDCTNEIN